MIVLEMSDIPKLPMSVKEMVKSGVLKLFQHDSSVKINDIAYNYKYILYMGDTIYLLKDDGTIACLGNQAETYPNDNPVIFK